MFFEARCNPAQVFDPVEEPFDLVSFLVKRLGEAVAMLPIDLVGNVGRGPLGLDGFPDPVRVVGLVAEHNGTTRQVGQKQGRALGVMGLARRQRQLDRQAPRVGQGMNLGGQSSSATPHTMNSVVFLRWRHADEPAPRNCRSSEYRRHRPRKPHP